LPQEKISQLERGDLSLKPKSHLLGPKNVTQFREGNRKDVYTDTRQRTLKSHSGIIITLQTQYILWRIDPLLSSDSVNSGRCYVTSANIHARNKRKAEGTGWPSYTPRHSVPISSPPTTHRAVVEVSESPNGGKPSS
jgi:hypothetical protein